MSNLTLPSVNGASVVEYQAIDGYPEAYQVTIQRRMLTPSGDKYRASPWTTLTAGDVRREVRLEGPVAEWLHAQGRADLSAARLAAYADEEPAHLSCGIPTLDRKEAGTGRNTPGGATPRT
jgi:hypothetical protein